MTKQAVATGWMASLAACLVLSACAVPPKAKTGVVHEQITQELGQAASARSANEAAEKALMPPITVELPKEKPSEPRFDLAVSDAPATQVFMAIASGTRYNMLVSPEVTGRITVNLKDVTVPETLEALRELYGYEFRIQGNRIHIQGNTLQTRVFQVNYLASRRQGSTDLRVTSSAISGSNGGSGSSTPSTGSTTPPAGTGGGASNSSSSGLTSRVQTYTDNDFWRDLQTALTTLVGSGEGRSVIVNGHSGVVVVKALPQEIRGVENYLKATQAIVERQVMLEAKVIEVGLNAEYQSGINWANFLKWADGSKRLTAGAVAPDATLRPSGSLVTSAVTVTPGTAGSVVTSSVGGGFFGLALQTDNFAALLNFLETQGSVSVLSSPRIATLNNQKAVLKVGTDDLFVTSVTTTTTATTSGSVSTPSLTLQAYFSGISLDVTPQIDDNNNIILHVHPAVSQVAEKEKLIDLGALGQYKLPLASSSVNESDSIVRVQNTHIVAIGGLMKQEQTRDASGLPGTTETTGGGLFGQRASTLRKRELVILLKPTVIGDDRAWADDIEQTSARIRALDPRSLPPRP